MRPVVPAALFLHGAGAWGGQWAVWRRGFEATGWQVATPDLVPETPQALAADTFAARLARARAAHAALPPGAALVGASLGGLIAYALAGTAVPAVPLVLVNPLPPAPFAARLPPLDGDDAAFRWRSTGRFAGTARALPGSPFADQHFAFRHWRDEQPALLRAAHAGIALPRPAGPVLLLASANDREVPQDLGRVFAEAIGAAFVGLPGSHLDPVMGPGAASAAALALSWLNGCARHRPD